MCFFSFSKHFVVALVHKATSSLWYLAFTSSIADIILSPCQNTPGLLDPKHFLRSDAKNPRSAFFSDDTEAMMRFEIWYTSPTTVQSLKPPSLSHMVSVQQLSNAKTGSWSIQPHLANLSCNSFAWGTLSLYPVPAVHINDTTWPMPLHTVKIVS